MKEEFKALLKDRALAHEFLSKQTLRAAQNFLAAHGIDMSIEEIDRFDAKLASMREMCEGEVSDDELVNVAGGVGDQRFEFFSRLAYVSARGR